MGTRPIGFSEATYRKFLIDAGDIRVDYVNDADPGTLLCATRGGNVFTIEQEIRQMPVDGAHGHVKGDKRIISVTAKLKCNCVEHSPEMWLKALPGAVTTEDTEYIELSRNTDISSADYIGNLAIRGIVTGSGIDGEYAVLMIKNALCIGNFEASMVDKEEAVITLEFTGHYDPANLDAEPWLMRYPSSALTTAGE